MIEVNNLTTIEVDENLLKEIARKVLDREGKREANLSIALIGEGRMRKLNKKYRGKNRVTDVLSFPESDIAENFKRGPLQKNKEIGEVVICLREVKKRARRFNSSFEKELFACLIHGILHLLGYDHEKSEKEAERMFKKQDYYLSKI